MTKYDTVRKGLIQIAELHLCYAPDLKRKIIRLANQLKRPAPKTKARKRA